MSSLPQDDTTGFVASALSSLSIGVWSWEGTPDSVRCCPVAARLFGVTAWAGEHGVPLEHFAQSVHPDDRARFLAMIDEACNHGGAFSAEYRTLPDGHRAHWILDHGTFETDQFGQVIAARGIVVDMTDRLDREGFRGNAFFAPHVQALAPLEQAVEHALAFHALMDVIPSEQAKLAQALSSQILQLLARDVAETLKASGITVGSDTTELLN